MLGDLLCCVPALRALRREFPVAEITLVGLPWAKDFAARFRQYLDDFIEFPGFPAFPEQAARVREFPAFLSEMQTREFDLTVQLHGSGGIVNPLIYLFNAKINAGFYKANEWRPDAATFLEYPEHEHEIRRYLRLLEFLNFAPETIGDELEFPLTTTDESAFAKIAAGNDLSGNYAVFHVGSNYATRRWTPEKFAFVADELTRQTAFQIIFTGTNAERELVAAVTNKMSVSFVDLVGKTDLGALGCLIKNARIIVANDSSVAHIAAALKRPSVTIFLAADARRWLPLNKAVNKAVYADVACRPCDHAICPANHECAELIAPEAVLSAIAHQLSISTADGR